MSASTHSHAPAPLFSGGGANHPRHLAPRAPLVLALAGALAAPAAAAQGGFLEEVIVTAEKRETTLQDTAIAVSAFSQDDLNQAQINNNLDIQLAVPNMLMTRDFFTTALISIRGVGNLAVGSAGDVGVGAHYNGAYLANSRIFETEYFDSERVEVLRGPQGTLYGRNTTAGVVNVITQKPEDEYGGYLNASAGNYGYTRIKSALNFPFSDHFQQRFSVFHTARDGFVENIRDGESLDDRNMHAIRSSTSMYIGDADIHLTLERFQERDNRMRGSNNYCAHDPDGILGCLPNRGRPVTGVPHIGSTISGNLLSLVAAGTGAAAATPEGMAAGLRPLSFPMDASEGALKPANVREVNYDFTPAYEVEEHLATLEINYEYGDYSIHSLTSYHDANFDGRDDYDKTVNPAIWKVDGKDGNCASPNPQDRLACTVYQRGPDGPSLVNYLEQSDHSSAAPQQWVQEFRIRSDFDGPLNFLAGAFYLDYETETHYYVYTSALSLYGQYSGTVAGLARGIEGALDALPTVDATIAQVNGGIAQVDGGITMVNGGLTQVNAGIAGLELIPAGMLTAEQQTQLAGLQAQRAMLQAQLAGLQAQRTELEGNLAQLNLVKPTVAAAEAAGLTNPALLRTLQDVSDKPETWLFDNDTTDYSLESWAVFGELYWDVVDDLQLTFGLRYTEEEKSSLQRTIFLSFQSDPNAPGGGYDEFESDSQELTGKFNLNYAPVDDVLLFATASRSYKSGGFNPITRANAEMLGVSSEYDPEFINSAEIGAKMRLVGNTLQANLTGFYYDFEDLQVGRIAGQTAINENTDAEVMGFEGEFLWAPSERWQATVNLSYLDTELGEFITIDTADPNQMGTTAGIISTGLSNVVLACSTPDAQCLGIPVNVEGNELPGAPQFTAYAALRYTWPLANGMHASASANYYYQDEFFTRIHNTADDLLDEWDIWNASLSLSGADEDWYAELWVRNIQDEDHWTGQRLLDPGLGLFRTFQLLEPRTYGLTFGISF